MTRADARFLAISVVVGTGVSYFSDFRIFLATGAIIAVVIARSVGFLYADTRMVSLCHMSFVGIGGWTVGWLTLDFGIPAAAALALGGLAAVPVGVVVGLPALRLRGVDLAVVTLGFAAAIQVVVFNRGFPGARSNFTIPRPDIATSEVRFLWFTLGVAALLELGVRLVRRHAVGTAWALVGQSERATAAAGRSVVVTKLTAFAVSAFVAGVAGGLLALQIGRLSARQLEPFDSLVVFALTVMAGSAHTLGAVLAGVLSVWMPELLRVLGWSQDIGPMIFAIGAAQVLSQGGGGIAGQWIALAGRLGRRRRRLKPVASEVGNCLVPTVSKQALVVEHLTVAYGSVRAVDRVSLRVGPGEMVGMIGANGAGKSTVIDAVTGYVPAEGGTVSLGSKSLASLAVHHRTRAGLSRTFQRERTPTNLTVGKFIAVAARDRTSAAQRDWLLSLFSLPAPDTPIGRLDTAERRRLELAAAFCAAPSVALVDEPAAGLDDEESRSLGSALVSIATEWEIGIVLIEHDLHLVRQVCESVIVLDQGQVIAAGPTARTLDDPRVTAAYLGLEDSAS